ncbi:MAG: hypothetical protein AB1420_12240 [Bacillota bacterium]
MGSIIWKDRILMSFSEDNRELIASSLDRLNMDYQLVKSDIKLLPSLKNKVLILKSLDKSGIIISFLETLKKELTKEGALVLFDDERYNKQSAKYLDTQMIICLSESTQVPFDLVVYLPINASEISLALTSNLLKRIAASGANISYKVASFWDKLCAYKYWNYLINNPTSTIVLQIRNSSIFEKFHQQLCDWINNSVKDEIGTKPTKEDFEAISYVLSEINSSTMSNNLLKEKQLLEQVISERKEQEVFLKQLTEACKQKEAEIRKYEDTRAKILEVEKAAEMIEIKDNGEPAEENNKQQAAKGSINRKIKKAALKKIVNTKEKNSYNQGGFGYRQIYVPQAFPIRIPVDGPVYQFIRPSPKTTTRSIVPPKIPVVPQWSSPNLLRQFHNATSTFNRGYAKTFCQNEPLKPPTSKQVTKTVKKATVPTIDEMINNAKDLSSAVVEVAEE